MTTDREPVTVLVGAPASGKTTVRRRLLADGVDVAVLSLDDERAVLQERDRLAGRQPRLLQDYSHRAVLHCAAAAQALLADGRGYLADATNLRRRERVAHVRAAHAAGLRAVAVLLPHLPVEVLAERDARRPEAQRVPVPVLAKHAHRRSLLSAALLREEGFDDVVEVVQDDRPHEGPATPPGAGSGAHPVLRAGASLACDG